MSTILDNKFPRVWFAIHAWTGATPGPDAQKRADVVETEIQKLVDAAYHKGKTAGVDAAHGQGYHSHRSINKRK